MGSAGWLIAMWVLGTITVIAAVSYGELSAMFPKQVDNIYIRSIWKLVGFLYGWVSFAVIQTGTIAAVGVAFAKFTAYLFQLLVIKYLV
jgi:APA family basic amino acid/polyamine antiporter